MLWISPTEVRLGGAELGGVVLIALEERALRMVEEWTDLGPHPVFADVPERRTTLRVQRTPEEGEALAVRAGDAATLSFRASASGADGRGDRVAAEVVVLSSSLTLDSRRGPTQVVECLAVSSDGAASPVVIEPASG